MAPRYVNSRGLGQPFVIERIDMESIAQRSLSVYAKHGMWKTPTHIAWMSMNQRCSDKNAANFALYGGRGIKVCDRWRGSDGFTNFLSDMGERPYGHTIDRIDVHGNYEPGNCRWATPKQQNRNKTTNKLLTINGVTKCLSEWAEISMLNRCTISSRLDRGYSPHDAVFATNQRFAKGTERRRNSMTKDEQRRVF